ncbi:MAG: ASKHA domain-containing protein [Coriobacteriales bacterium]|jgi:uncharacterized 2Fe-2S/4Fe-4S cluster protein (DUF4445 family)|nr:ASKHA domain-containing protein [Coriobacteriales bacterium]
MPKLTIYSEQKKHEVEFNVEKTVLECIQSLGLTFHAPCGGKGNCKKCSVDVEYIGNFEANTTGKPHGIPEANATGKPHGISEANATVTQTTFLACQVMAKDGMIVFLRKEDNDAMSIDVEGTKTLWTPTPDATGLGIAFDLGTTTLAARLIDMRNGNILAQSARVNPQTVFGADVISRIDASMTGKLPEMTACIREALIGLIDELLQQHESESRAFLEINKIVLAGNTVMQHIFCSMPPDSIGVAPFTPLSLFGDNHTINELPVPLFMAPCIGSYVGGDISCGMLVSQMDDTSSGTGILVDLGTNGELALCHNGRIICCATAAGPVFEGANIRYGMPALPGAINAVFHENGRLRLETIANASASGFCGTGIIDIVAHLVNMGIVDETGMMSSSGFDGLGLLDGHPAFYPLPNSDICITQEDIRNLQLGKSAIMAGIRVLLEAANVTVDEIRFLHIAGGFGKKLNLKSAARIGLFPIELLDRASAIGNSCIEGASAALVSTEAMQRLLAIPKQCEYIELSTSASFNMHFMQEMMF